MEAVRACVAVLRVAVAAGWVDDVVLLEEALADEATVVAEEPAVVDGGDVELVDESDVPLSGVDEDGVVSVVGVPLGFRRTTAKSVDTPLV